MKMFRMRAVNTVVTGKGKDRRTVFPGNEFDAAETDRDELVKLNAAFEIGPKRKPGPGRPKGSRNSGATRAADPDEGDGSVGPGESAEGDTGADREQDQDFI